ncbi:MAG: tetratricopeptide repeat protein, partial [Nitrospiraceae bacterium]
MTADSSFHKAEKFKSSARYKDALLLFKRAKRAYEKDNIVEGRLRCLMSIGDIYRMTGKFELAEKNYSEAVKISSKIKDKTTAADAAVGLGLSARGLGRWKEALKI